MEQTAKINVKDNESGTNRREEKNMNKRRRLAALVAAFIFAIPMLSVTACGRPVSNGLMEGASPSTSALTLYHYDGEAVSFSYIYDAPAIQSLLDELDAVKATKAEKWSLEDISPPIYGFNINATDGWGIFAAWSNGYWIKQDGTAYKFNFDFAELEKKYPSSGKQNFPSFSIFPCAYFLTQDESGWNDALLTPAKEKFPSTGVTMTLESWGKTTVTVNITNNGAEDWMYGEYFGLEVSLNGVWYEFPATPGNWGFNDIGFILKSGETQNKTYNLTMYGEFPPGTYRLVAFDLSAEATLP